MPHATSETVVPATFTLRVLASPSTPSIATLESRFELRHRAEGIEAADLSLRYAAMRRQYNEQSLRAKHLFADPRLKQPSCSVLFRLALGAVKISRHLYDAFRRAEAATPQGNSTIVPVEVVREALDWHERQLERLERQFEFLNFVDALTPMLRTLVAQLQDSPRQSALGWRSVARRLIAEVERVPNREAILPFPDFSLAAYLADTGGGGEALGRGIQTARWVARVLLDRNESLTQTELLIVASLCQDCGLLLPTYRGRSALQRQAISARLRVLHASIGAALVAGMLEFVPDLPLLVAEHHRRLIGLEGSADLSGSMQKRGSRLLSVAVRLFEIVEELPAAPAAEEAPERLASCHPAALQIVREASLGEWDLSVTGEMLASLGFGVESRTEDMGLKLQDANWGIGEWRRLDAGASGLPAPNLALADHVRGRRYAHESKN